MLTKIGSVKVEVIKGKRRANNYYHNDIVEGETIHNDMPYIDHQAQWQNRFV